MAHIFVIGSLQCVCDFFCHRYLAAWCASLFPGLCQRSVSSLGLAVHGALPTLHKIRKGRSFHFAIFITFTVWIIHLSVAARISHFSFFLSLPHLRALHERCCEWWVWWALAALFMQFYPPCVVWLHPQKYKKLSTACIMPHSAQIKRRSKPKKSTPHFCCSVHEEQKKLFSFALQLNRWDSYCTSINYFMVPAHVKRVLFSLICFLGHNDDAWEISFLYSFLFTRALISPFISACCVRRNGELTENSSLSAPAGRHRPISNYYDDARRISSALWSPNELCVYGASGPVFSHLPDGPTLRSTQRVRCALLAEGWNDDDK